MSSEDKIVFGQKFDGTSSVEANSIESPNVESFRRIATSITELYSRKNEAYGDSFSRSVYKYGPIAALTRISDKFNRIENLILGAKNTVPDESLYDTLLDLASYSIMTVMAIKALEPQPVDFENV